MGGSPGSQGGTERSSGIPGGRSGLMGVSGLDDTGHVQALLFDQGERLRQNWLDTVAKQIRSIGGGDGSARQQIFRKQQIRFS